MKFVRLVATEFLKLRRSRVTWISWAAYSFIGLVCALFIWIIKNPGMAESLGLIGQKARFSVGAGTAQWSTLLGMIEEMSGVGGMIMLSVIVTYLFGREYTEGMGKYLLSLPLGRGSLVMAKLATALVWFGALSLSLIAESFLAGSVLGLGGFTWVLYLSSAGRVLYVTVLLMALAPAVAWVAVASGGYLAPLGFTIFTVVLGTVFGVTDWAPWCPWSIIPLLTGAAGPARALLGTGSLVVLGATFFAGTAGTVTHLNLADNLQ